MSKFIWPTWKQFSEWSLPSKYALYSLVLAAVGIGIALSPFRARHVYSLDDFLELIEGSRVEQVLEVIDDTAGPFGQSDANAIATGMQIIMQPRANTIDPLRYFASVDADSPLYDLAVSLAVHYAQTNESCDAARAAVIDLYVST